MCNPLLVFSLTPNLFADDPYYCGLRARVPNFVNHKSGGGGGGGGGNNNTLTAPKSRGKQSTVEAPSSATKRLSVASKMHHQQHHHQSMAAIHHSPLHHHNHQQQPPHGGSKMLATHQHGGHYGQHHGGAPMYHAKSYESGIGTYSSDVVEPYYGGGQRQHSHGHDRRRLYAPTAQRHDPSHPTPTTHSALTKTRPQPLYDRNRPPLLRAMTTPLLLAATAATTTTTTRTDDAGQLLYDLVPQPRCVSCVSCRCQLQPVAAAPEMLMRWGSESDIYNPYESHQQHQQLTSLDSIDGPLMYHSGRHQMQQQRSLYGVRSSGQYGVTAPLSAPYVVQNLRRQHHQHAQRHQHQGPLMPVPMALPLHSFYHNQFCVQSDDRSPNGDVGGGGGVDDSLGDVAGLAFKLRKTASNESFFGYPIDVTVAPGSSANRKETPTKRQKTQPMGGCCADKQQRRLAVRQTKSSPAGPRATALAIEDSADAKAGVSDEISFYGYLKSRQAKHSRKSLQQQKQHSLFGGHLKGVELF